MKLPSPSRGRSREDDLRGAGANVEARRVPSSRDDAYARAAYRSGQTLLLLALAAVLCWLLAAVALVVVPVLIALMLAAALWPMVRWLRARGLPPLLAAWATLLTGAGALGSLAWLVVAGIRSEWGELRDGVDEGVGELQDYLAGPPLHVGAERLQSAREDLSAALSGPEVRGRVLDGAVTATEILAGAFLTLVVLFFLLKDGPRLWRFLVDLLPEVAQGRAERIGVRCLEVLGGFVRGTTVIALVDAVVIGAGLLLGVPLALPLAVVVFLGAYVPLLGATVAGFFAATVALVTRGPVIALVVVVLVVAVNQIEGDVLAPVVLGRALSLHPLVVLVALSVGVVLAGVVGALLAVPLAAVAWTTVTAWNGEGDTADGRAGGGSVAQRG
ncbi:MAG: AI-2E family transporter [Sporichthyaceae bacterium]